MKAKNTKNKYKRKKINTVFKLFHSQIKNKLLFMLDCIYYVMFKVVEVFKANAITRVLILIFKA